MFAAGAMCAVVVVHFFHLNAGWIFIGALALGWGLNEEERRRSERDRV
jgi:hypothetical protein